MAIPHLNAVGDVVLTDPHAMRALAQPGRLELLDRLRATGPAGADELSAPPGALEELERFGFVARADGARWEVVGRGLFLEVPDDDADAAAAARELGNAMLRGYEDLPARWLAEDEPRLAPEWLRVAGGFNARLTLTPGELRGLQDGLERLIEPFAARAAEDAPAGAARVRVLSYFMPEAPTGGDVA